jgi:hypothetical protein
LIHTQKPVIEHIQFTDEDKQFISDILQGRPTAKSLKYWEDKGMDVEHHTKRYRPPHPKNRLKIIREKYKIGVCHSCANLADYKVLYKMPDITLVEFWCQDHLPSQLTTTV